MNFISLFFGFMTMKEKRKGSFNRFGGIDLCGYRCNRQK